MSQRGIRIVRFALVTLLCVGCATPPPGSATGSASGEAMLDSSAVLTTPGWPRWGGPGGDFKVVVEGLAESWPEDGPPVLWRRPLGAGYSTIAAVAGTLYTIYRDDEDDVVIALRADDGETVWEHRYRAPTREGNSLEFGKGPHATPLILADRLVTLGYTGVLSCLDRKTGEPIWTHDLIPDFEGEVLEFGYSASPILHDGKVIVLVGGSRYAVAAFDPQDGSVAWASAPSSVSYATPVVIEVGGRQQIVYMAADQVIGIDATDGSSLWSFPVLNQYRNNSTDPIWGDDGLLWVATQLDGGTRVLRLTGADGGTKVEEVWTSDRLSIHFWPALRLGNMVYASIGGNASILAGVDIHSGEIVWRERGFERAKFVHTGSDTLLLDAEGRLALVRLGPDGMTIKAQAQVLDSKTWTAPTLVGSRLYVRDQQSILALDLSQAP